jgi:phosphoglycerate dehydrogenase-like enzyme
MTKPRLSIPDDYPPVMGPSNAYKMLKFRADVDYHESLPDSADTLISRIGEAPYVVNIRSSVRFSSDVLERLRHVKLLSIWGTGTDHVDLDAAARLGLTVTNTPGVSAIAMAEHTLALMLSVARDIPRIDAKTKRGGWPRGFVTQLHGKTLGVIGLGAIGAQTVRIARGIGMKVIAWTMHPESKRWDDLGARLVELDELYRASDVVSLHLRQSPETAGFIGEREFGLMKPTAIFINTARGPIVDESALAQALKDRRIWGAGIDVYEREPEIHPALLECDNAILTPHIGSAEERWRNVMTDVCFENVRAVLRGERAPNTVG